MVRRSTTASSYLTGRYLLLGEPAPPPGQDPLLHEQSHVNLPENCYLGTASVPFPSLSSSGKVENGLWCRGCDFVVDLYAWHGRDVYDETWEYLKSLNVDILRVLLGWARRARSRVSFLEHIKGCDQAQLHLECRGACEELYGTVEDDWDQGD
ncbi:hypothetical protein VTK56DRAFT_9696 [Thermocarpiscus australiensis]